MAVGLALLPAAAGPRPATATTSASGRPAPVAAAPDNSGHIYILDGFGAVHRAGGAPVMNFGAYWPGWDIARSFALFADGTGGYVLDGFGGIHPTGSAPSVLPGGYWPNWDIARSIVLAPWASASDPEGWVLDGFGGIHAFGGAPAVPPSAYWPGWDIARAIVVGGPATKGAAAPWGYVLDGYGGLHPFGGAPSRNSAYWPGWEIAHSIALLPGTAVGDPAGYVLDGFGGIHPFGPAPAVQLPAYWPGWDIARSLTLWTGAAPGAAGGWVLDGWGGLHAFGGAPPISGPYWPGWDIAKATAGTGTGTAGRTSSRVLGVPVYRQTHNLDCEATALQMALAWQGRGVSQDTLIASIGVDFRPPVSDSTGWHWGDPYASFVGSVDGSQSSYTGYGVYYPPIARVDEQYGGHVAQAGEWIPPSEIYQAVLGGRPAIVWVDLDWRYHPASSYVAFDGRPALFAAPWEHAVIVVGVNSDSVLVNNPLTGQQWISKRSFESAYSTYNGMAVILG